MNATSEQLIRLDVMAARDAHQVVKTLKNMGVAPDYYFLQVARKLRHAHMTSARTWKKLATG